MPSCWSLTFRSLISSWLYYCSMICCLSCSVCECLITLVFRNVLCSLLDIIKNNFAYLHCLALATLSCFLTISTGTLQFGNILLLVILVSPGSNFFVHIPERTPWICSLFNHLPIFLSVPYKCKCLQQQKPWQGSFQLAYFDS